MLVNRQNKSLAERRDEILRGFDALRFKRFKYDYNGFRALKYRNQLKRARQKAMIPCKKLPRGFMEWAMREIEHNVLPDWDASQTGLVMPPPNRWRSNH